MNPDLIFSLVKEYKQKVGTLKRKQSMEKKNSATLLEEARKREDSLYDDASQLEVSYVCF